MSYRLTDLVDLGSLRALLESLHHATGILQGLVAADGEVLTEIGWQDVCTRFHRVHPCTNARCQAATRSLAGRAISAPFVGARCGNGLTEYAAAVVVEGDHLATLFFQVLHEPPDLEVFRAQARECGFDEQAYVAAIRAVPVMPTERVTSIMTFYADLARMLAQSGLDRLRQREAEQRLAERNRDLAALIDERTRELAVKNAELQREIDERRQVEQDLRASKKRLRAVMDASPIAMGWTNQAGEVEYVNRRFTELFGWEKDDVRTAYAHLFADDGAGASARYARAAPPLGAANDGGEDTVAALTEKSVVCKDGSIRHVVMGVTWAGDRRLGTFLDVTDRWLADQRELARHASLALIARDAPLDRTLSTILRGVQVEDSEVVCSILVGDVDGATLYVDASGSRPAAGAHGHHPDCVDHGSATAPSCWTEEIRSSAGLVLAVLTVCHRHRRVTQDRERRIIARACQLVSIAIERHRARDELERQARTDFLTALPNRRRLFEVAKDELDRAARYGRPFSVLMIDLDHFKDINDAHGHEGGDAVLRAIAETLRETVRGLDTMGRLGGEEFAAVLPEASLQGALETAERLRLAVERARPTLPDGARVSVTVSIGVAALTDGVLDLETVFARADEALYAAKAAGRNRVRSLSGLAPARAARP